MRFKKTDFQIVFHDHNKFGISVRKRFLKFFSFWIPLTYQETEYSDDKPLVFDTFEEATKFIDTIAE